MRLALHRALLAEELEVGIRIGDERRSRGRSRSRRSRSQQLLSSQLDEGRHPARGEELAPEVEGDLVGRSEQAFEHHRALEKAVKRMVGGEADPGEHLLAVGRNRARGAPGRRLRERGGERVRLVGGRAQRRLERLRPPRTLRRVGAGRLGTTRSPGRTARAPTRTCARGASIVRLAPRIWCATARRPSATADSHAAASSGSPAAAPCVRRARCGSPRRDRRRAPGAHPSPTAGTVTARSSDPASHTTSSSRAVATRAVASPTARACRRR